MKISNTQAKFLCWLELGLGKVGNALRPVILIFRFFVNFKRPIFRFFMKLYKFIQNYLSLELYCQKIIQTILNYMYINNHINIQY